MGGEGEKSERNVRRRSMAGMSGDDSRGKKDETNLGNTITYTSIKLTLKLVS